MSDLVLIVAEGQPAGIFVSVESSACLIGRERGCTLPVDDLTVSRRHCQVWSDSGKCFVLDLGSTNRTMVNGKPVTLYSIDEGDELRLGRTRVMLLSARDAAAIAVRMCRGQPARRVDNGA